MPAYPFAQTRAAYRVEAHRDRMLRQLFQQRGRPPWRACIDTARRDGHSEKIIFEKPVVGKHLAKLVHLSRTQIVKGERYIHRPACRKHRRRRERRAQCPGGVPRTVYAHTVEKRKAFVGAKRAPHRLDRMRLKIVLVPVKQVSARRGRLGQPTEIGIGDRFMRHCRHLRFCLFYRSCFSSRRA